MAKASTPTTPVLADPLRAEAEALAARLPAAARPAGPVTALRHELQVHRIELEMQNEELRRSRDALEAARDRYIDLYDFAPVGYLTLDKDGLIVEANLTVARMLGIERGRLVGRRFARQVAPADRDRWHRFALASARSDEPGRIELQLQGAGGRSLDTQLDLQRVQPQGGGTLLRMALTDIATRKRAELYKRLAAAADAAREADSRRVSLQLHEGLGQRLCALKMDLEDLQGSPARLPRQARDARVGAILSEVDALVAMVRRMSSDLRPAMLDDLGLHAALEWLVHDTAGRLEIAMTLKQDDIQPPLDDAGALAVYRLVQAMLDRLPRHEQASDVAISVSRLAPGLVVCLQAQGLAAGGAAGTAQDVLPLGERVHALGGHLTVEPALESARPGTTRVTVRVPLEAAQEGLRLRLSQALA